MNSKKRGIKKKKIQSKKNKNFNISIMQKSRTNNARWKGSGRDILFGMIYLKEKYKNLCLPLSTFYKNDIMLDTTIQYECVLEKGQKYAKRQDYKLLFPGNDSIGGRDFIKKILECIKNNKRFVMIPLYLIWNECDITDAHYNYIVIDTFKKPITIERFDPFGVFKDDSEETLEWFDLDFKKYMRQFGVKFKYYSPEKYCPDVGFQGKEELNISRGNANEINSDPGGFCGVWSIYYGELRLRYPNIPINKLVELSLEKLSKSNISLREFIRNYSRHLKKQKYKIIKKVNKKCMGISKNSLTSKICTQEFIDKELIKFLK